MDNGARIILANGDVAGVFDRFGKYMSDYYKIDVRKNRTYSSCGSLRMVQSMVAEYGAEDAGKIVDTFFDARHCGLCHGKPIGINLFAKGYRWFASELLLESSYACGGELRWQV